MRVIRMLPGALGALAVLLGACGPGEEPAATDTLSIAEPCALFARADAWRFETAAGAVLERAALEAQDLPHHIRVKERLDRAGWRPLGPLPDHPELRLWEYPLTRRSSAGTTAGETELVHPTRPVQACDAAGGELSENCYAVLPAVLFLALPEQLEHPGAGYELEYPSRSAWGEFQFALRASDLRPSPQRVELRGESRPAILLPPGSAAVIRLRPGAGARLSFAIGLDEELARGANPELRFELGLREASDAVLTLWSQSLSTAERGRFLDVEIPLAPWAERDVELVFSVSGGTPRGEELVWLAAPRVDTPRADAAPSVLLVLVDTLRADALGCYGNPRGLSPTLDALAAEGVCYAHARASSPWTLPSIASLFTSLMPTQHRVAARGIALPENFVTLAETLAARGWRTAAFTGGGFVSPGNGLEQGFQRFDARGGGVGAVTARALEWIARSDTPFFAFVHTYQVHDPYDPPTAFRARFVRPYDGPIERDRAVHTTELIANMRERDWRPTPADTRYVRDLYDAEVAYTDRVLGEFFTWLRESGRWDRTLVTVTSDHGEEFFEHGGWGHALTLYEEQLRVPLIMNRRGSFSGGLRVAAPVRLLDLAPTILQELDLAIPPRWEGRTLRETAAPRELFAARLRGEKEADILALLAGQKKWIWTGDAANLEDPAARAERYDLERDPGELQDLQGATSLRELAGQLTRLLARFADLTGGEHSAAELSRRALDQIRALGY